MVRHQLAKFGGLRHCGSENITLLGVEEQDSTVSHMACHALTLEISERRHGYLPFYVNKFDIGYMHLE